MPLPSVVLVGRPNVGKSTLFNRLGRSRKAIVAAIPGTTRDVIAQPAEWQGARFEVIDTGGMFGASQDPLHALVLERGRRAIADADLLVLVVDGREGLVPADREIADVVRAANRPVVLAVSRKGVIGTIIDRPRSERMVGSIAAACLAAARGGVHVVRVHDVGATQDAVRLIEAFAGCRLTI